MNNQMIVLRREEAELVIKKVVEQAFAAYIPELHNALIKPSDFVDYKRASSELKISRQTLNNWFKSNQLLGPYRKKIGGKYFYNVQGIKKVLEENPLDFGKMRDENYSFQVTATEKEKRDFRYGDINSKITERLPISDSDKEFYQQFCKETGRKRYLRDLHGC